MPDPSGVPTDPVVVVVDHLYDFHRRLLDGVVSELAPRGVPVLVAVCSLYHHRAPGWLRRRLQAGRVGGVVVLPLQDPRAQAELLDVLAAQPDVPAVGVGVPVPGRPLVASDNRRGLREVVDHVLDQGVRRVALVRGVRHHADSAEREAVVRRALADRGLALDEDLVVDGDFDRDPAYRAFGALRAARGLDGVQAVVALNDISAFGVLDVLAEAGRAVPDDVLVTGFDDHPSSAHPDTALTTVDPGLVEQGVVAARLLLRLVAGEPVEDVVVPSRAVLRSSTGGARPERPALAKRGAGMTSVGLDHTVLAMVRSFADARTRTEVMHELAAVLPRLGVVRAFVVLREPPVPVSDVAADAADGRDPTTSPDEETSPVGRVLLRFPGSASDERPQAVTFPTDDLLPPHLAAELESGVLVRHVLEVRGVELGYALAEQEVVNGRSVELVRLELSRTLDGIARTEQLARHAVELEALVRERTRQLEREVGVRRRAEGELRAANAELRESLHVDGLTGIANRGAFDVRLAELWADGAAQGRALSVLLVDVDHFKAYNDSYGHLLGDEALRDVARSLREACADVVAVTARYGGEEFAVLLPGTDSAGARVVAERVRAVLGSHAVPHMASGVSPVLTVSVGSATGLPAAGHDPLELVRHADVALYRAKRAGRDRVCLHGEALIDFRRG